MSSSNLEFQNRTEKSLVFVLTKLQTGLPKNDDSFRDSGKNYFSYLKLPTGQTAVHKGLRLNFIPKIPLNIIPRSPWCS